MRRRGRAGAHRPHCPRTAGHGRRTLALSRLFGVLAVQVSSSLLGQLLLLLLGRTPSSLTLLFAISAAATAVACGLSLALPSPRPRPAELVAPGSAGCSRASLLSAEVQAWPSVQCRAIASSTTLDVGVIATARLGLGLGSGSGSG